MKWKKPIISLLLIPMMFSCQKNWDEHYNSTPETVDRNIWEVLQEEDRYSDFVALVQDLEYDTLFANTDVYTIFVPDNDAIQAYSTEGSLNRKVLNYHLSDYFIQSQNIKGKQRILTRSEKFAYFENTGSAMYFDEIELGFESPLYKNGKFFEITEVADPLPNIFEYFEEINPVFSNYVESLDSIILDKELSRPIGYDSLGNTVYDTVAEVYNEFEDEYFPIREEFRTKSATMVFPDQEKYNAALDEMATFLGGNYITHEDIPLEWQEEILMPYLAYNGVFENRVEPYEFDHPPYPDTLKMKNILGDSIYVQYLVEGKALCSNGYAYNYKYFSIPDTLYRSPQRMEGESLLKPLGGTRFTWQDDVDVTPTPFEPTRPQGSSLSNDSMLHVLFTPNYAGEYEVEFTFPNLFPGDYLMVVRTNYTVGGVYDIFINDEQVFATASREYSMDYFEFLIRDGFPYNGTWRGITGNIYRPTGAINSFDCLAEVTSDYGQTKVKFVYKEKGDVQNNGLTIDYIDFIPLEN